MVSLLSLNRLTDRLTDRLNDCSCWYILSTQKVLSVTAQGKKESSRLTLSSIQKEIEQVLDEKKASPVTPAAVKQPERYSATKTPGK